ncbi:MAG: DUF421 domain-containing protein [Acholeplasmataceae bacterium]|nr:DUF421 domain-containing protein [Acholeplasmataceae bacterium]
MNEGLVVIVRGLISFFTLLIYTRILGKQQVSHLTFFEYIMGITIGSIAASMTVDLSSRAWPHFLGLTVWFLAVYILQIITLKSRKLSIAIDGKPVIVMAKGKILEEVLRKNRFKLSELTEMLRDKGVFDLAEVDYAIIETSGKLSVLKKPEYQPLSPNDMKLKPKYKGLFTDLIYGGKILEESLRDKQLSRAWLTEVLKQNNIKHHSDVFYAAIDESGNLYIDRYQDHLILKNQAFEEMKRGDES